MSHYKPKKKATKTSAESDINSEINNNCFTFRDVELKYDNKTIWSEGNFSIKKSSTVAIIGSNGSGKTSLIKALMGQLKPSNGKIIISNAIKIGYVAQKYDTENDALIRGLDYLKTVLNSEKQKIKRNEKNKKIEEALKKVGAEKFVKRRLSQLSGGQRQRISIASALVNENDLLIFDEPLSSLDLTSAKEVIEIFAKISRETNKTILIVAHDLGLLLPILTGAIYLLDGHAHYSELDDAEHKDYRDLLNHLTTMKVGEHEL